MKPFFLNCWVPSLKIYTKITELKIFQFEILAKYLLNEDDDSINEVFNEILRENLDDKSIYFNLNRYDKWFMLLFLRASSVSSMLYYKAKGEKGDPCAVSFNLFDILTDLSEINIPNAEPLVLDDLIITFSPVSNLYSPNFLHESILKVEKSNKEYYPNTFSREKRQRFFNTLNNTVIKEIYDHLMAYESKFENVYIIKNEKKLKDFYSINFNLFGNTLYGFLKSTFQPHAQGLYKKKYTLLTKLGIDNTSILNFTPSECDIYLNMLNSKSETNSKEGSVSLF
jgi:hypothetical protein